MDISKLREDFEGLPPEDKMEFMASVGPAFCRSMMADPARRRQMFARCVRGNACSMGRVAGALAGAGLTVAALIVGVRAAASHLARRTTSEAAG